jgi:hypothetical protein
VICEIRCGDNPNIAPMSRTVKPSPSSSRTACVVPSSASLAASLAARLASTNRVHAGLDKPRLHHRIDRRRRTRRTGTALVVVLLAVGSLAVVARHSEQRASVAGDVDGYVAIEERVLNYSVMPSVDPKAGERLTATLTLHSADDRLLITADKEMAPGTSLIVAGSINGSPVVSRATVHTEEWVAEHSPIVWDFPTIEPLDPSGDPRAVNRHTIGLEPDESFEVSIYLGYLTHDTPGSPDAAAGQLRIGLYAPSESTS